MPLPKTRWHITFGTYAGRLHGSSKPTVDRSHNSLGEPHIIDKPNLERFEHNILAERPILLTPDQRLFIESIIPELCRRGGWDFVECGAQPNHIHVVCDIDPAIHGKRARALLKRWLTQALDERWTGAIARSDGMSWWAEGGSARAVRGQDYRAVVRNYVADQRATQPNRPAPSDPF